MCGQVGSPGGRKVKGGGRRSEPVSVSASHLSAVLVSACRCRSDLTANQGRTATPLIYFLLSFTYSNN